MNPLSSITKWAFAPFLFSFFFLLFSEKAIAQPAGFTDQLFMGGWNEVAGFTWDPLGRMFVWERDGRVWIVDNGVKSSQPLLDISDEVGGWRDFGLLGFALDPNFLSNGYFYLLYVVDRHHLLNAGTPQYNPNTDTYFAATIGRITRYQANAATSFTSLVPNSRFVLVGVNGQDGPPILHESHGTGSLVFGDDGTLLATLGDGASYSSTDQGSATETYWSQALSDGIITSAENIGAYRCQTLDNYSGKILRIDPLTGNGLPSNPYYDAANPKSPASRVWARGVRNPYRMTKVPESGSHVPSDANPGVFIFGDVGWSTKEELNIVTGPGMNFGWPKHEGITYQPGYNNASYAPSQHDRPKVEWRNGSTPRGLVNGTIYNVGSAQLPGPTFGGNASTGGVWFHGHEFPAEWHDTYFHADYGQGWIRNFRFDANWNPVEVKNFINTAGACVFLNTDPDHNSLYYVRWPDQIRQVSYTGTTNNPPVAIAEADVLSGTSPLTVGFNSLNSFDKDGDPLTYLWDFGDGTSSTSAHPVHTYTSGAAQGYTVRLTVTEANGGLSDQATLNISVNNQPPNIISTSLDAVNTFNPNITNNLSLSASVTDANHSQGQLTYLWDVRLFHNNHNHPVQSFSTPTATTNLTAVNCYTASYWYRVTLTVSDPTGASDFYQKDIFPACAGNGQSISFSPIPDKLVTDGPFDLNASASSGLLVTYYVTEGPATVLGNTVTLQGVPGKVTIAAAQPGNGTFGAAFNVERSFWVNANPQGSCDGSGLISREVWTGVSGTAVSQIPLGTAPNVTDQLGIFEIPFNTADNFGTRVRGFICPPTTGNYRFWIASDDNGELWLSTNDNPANKQLIANVPSWTNPREWGKFPSQQSALISLNAGQQYYIEALQKEGTGGDNLAVGWQLPNGTQQRPIPGMHLLPFTSGAPTAVISANPTAGNAPLLVSFNGSASSDPNGSITNYSWDFGDGTSGTGVSTSHTYSNAGAFTATLTVTDNSGQTATDDIIINVSSGGPQDQTINFPAISNKLTTDAPFVISATASSGLPVSFSVVSGPATISGNTVTLTGATGSVTIRASQGGNAQWNAAPAVNRTFQVNAPTGGSIDLSLSVASNPNFLEIYDYISATFTIQNNGSSTATNVRVFAPRPPGITWEGGNEWTASQGIYDYFGAKVWYLGNLPAGGSATLQLNWFALSENPLEIWGEVSAADQTDVDSSPGNGTCCTTANEDDEAALVVTTQGQGPQDQTITFAVIPNKVTTDAPFAISATATSGLPVGFQIVSGPATVSGNTVTLTGAAGTVTIRAVQGGNPSWKPAQSVERSFQVSVPGLQNQTITFGTLANKITTDPPFALSATASSGLPVNFSVVSGPASISGNTVTLAGTPGTVTIRASQSGNATYNPAPPVERSFQVTSPSGGGGGVDLELTMSASPATVTQWGNIAFTATLTNAGSVGATGVKVSFPRPNGVVFVGGNEVTVSKGTYGLFSDRIWNVGTMPAGATETITVNWFSLQESPLTGWAQVTAASPFDNDSTPGNGTCCIASEDDEAAFTAPLPGGGPQNQTITFPAIPDKFSNSAPFAISASATSGLPVNFSIVSGPASISGNTITLSGALGQVTVLATQAGNANWNAATPVERTFAVNQPGLQDQTITFPDIPNKLTTDAPFAISATASSGLPVSFAITNGPASISGNTITLNGTAGSVTVSASQSGNAQYNPASEVLRTFAVNQPGQGGGPDLEVTMTSSSPNLLIWKNVTFSIGVTNKGDVAATGIKLAVPVPQGLAHSSNSPSAGTTYNLYFKTWSIPSLAAGETATLDIALFCLQNTVPLPYFVQVTAQSPADVDSSPNNNASGNPSEDDEALIILAPNVNPLVAVNGAMFSVNAWKEGTTTQLKWVSTIGENAVDYVVERSRDGFRWEEIIIRPNELFENKREVYNDEDRYPLPGWNFYRIKQNRIDGTKLYSNVAMLEHWDDLHSFKLFPNPANDYVDINLTGVEGQRVRLLLVDRSGRLVKEMEVEKATTAAERMYLDEVKEGWYMMWIQAEGWKAKALPLVVGKR